MRRCAEAARPAGRVVILGGVVADESPAGLTIEIVLLGGKHRPLSAFRPLAHEAGLAIQAAGQLPSGRYAVECRPK